MNLEHNKKVAILLNALGDEAVDPALSLLEEEKSSQIRAYLSDVRKNPPPTYAIDKVLDDFERFFKFAIQAAGAENFWSRLTEDEGSLKFNPSADGNRRKGATANGESDFPAEDEPVDVEYEDGLQLGDSNQPIKRFRIFKPTEDEQRDLKKLHPAQIAEALSGERPKTISIVLQCLSKAQNAAVIKLLPEHIHGELLGLMIADVSVAIELKRRIIRTVVAKALTVEQREAERSNPMDEIAGILREMPRGLRNSMLVRLRENDEENANDLQKLLFLFEDIMLYDDRSIQKILGETDKGQLIIALQAADDEVTERVLENLSKRAKESLIEEMDLLGKQSIDAVEEARAAVTDVIATLDQSDQLELL
jgi:flagellar motor switch protein FliG